MIWTSSDIISVVAGVFMLFLVLIMFYIIRAWTKYTNSIKNAVKNAKCSNCIFGARKWKMVGSPPKKVSSPDITCRRNPFTTEHNPFDWCGDFCPSQLFDIK
ncbi:hypothetical protein LCGC14_0661460 [marine sediment metagenome]|uniref:Uncharacterized protein n=1 Tax=marine sediment metagenome TaxID=412755 RepID=A0A0F9U1Q9_9ZZZZ